MRLMSGTVFGVALALCTLPVVLVVAVTGTVAGAGPAASPSGTPGSVALLWALDHLGKPYAWGAAGPGAFDCSGLVLRAWEAAGVALPRVAADQYGAGQHVAVADAGPGDLVFFATDPRDPATIVHVGIALGDGRMVDAPHEGAAVRVEGIWPDGLVPLATRP